MSREEYQQDLEQRDDPGRNALGRCYWNTGEVLSSFTLLPLGASALEG